MLRQADGALNAAAAATTLAREIPVRGLKPWVRGPSAGQRSQNANLSARGAVSRLRAGSLGGRAPGPKRGSGRPARRTDFRRR